MPPGVDVTVAVPAGLGLPQAWQIAASEWEATTGARCVFQDVGTSGNPVPPESACLAVLPLHSLAALVDAGWPAPIDEQSPGYPLTREVFDGLRRAVEVHDGEAVAVPVDCPVLACYYRADLLEAAGLEPPATWDDYARLLAALSDWAPGLTAVEPWSDEFRASMLLARAVPAALHPDNFSLYLDVETGAPLIADPPFEMALDESIRVLTQLDPRSPELGPADCVRDVFAGRSALAIGSPATSLRGADSSPVSRTDESARIGVAPLPGAGRVYQRQNGTWQSPPDGSNAHRVILTGHDGWMVCASARFDPTTRSAAWNLWTSLESPELGGPARPWAAALVRSTRLADVLQRPADGFRSEEWRAQVQVVADSLNAWRVVFDLPLPERDRFRESLTQHVSAAIAGKETSTAALQAVNADWNTLIDELGRSRVVNVYRACSGLSPLPEP